MIPPIFALLSWPFIVYLFCRNRGPEITLIVAVLGGYLFLPERVGIDLPALYELNKVSIPVYTALVLCMVAVSRAQQSPRNALPQTAAGEDWLPGWIPRAPLPLFLIVLSIGGAIMTVVTNPDPIVEHGVTNFRRGIVNDTVSIPGLRLRDAGATTLIVLVSIIPLFLARKFFAHPSAQRRLLLAFCVAGLIYLPLVLFEARLSPQLHNWTYGFHAHRFGQHVRADGGFRPMIYLSHGLRVSIFLTATVLITIGLARLSEGAMRMRYLALAVALFGALVISKSLGALMIAVVLIPLLLFAPRYVLMLAAAGVVSCMLTYPILRGAGLVPVDAVLAFAEGISAERAQSFAYRLNFEDGLLAHTNERPFFGWGSWGRNLYLGDGVFAVPDGQWTLILSQYGWAGYIGRFGLMFLPVVLILLNARRYKIGMESAVIAAALAAAAVDLIPNSGMTPDKWLLAGALWGRLELGRISDKTVEDPPAVRVLGLRSKRAGQPALAGQPPAAADGPQMSRYTRQNRRIDRALPASPAPVRKR